MARPDREEPATAARDRAEYVRRLVDAAPPLTADQRARLSLLLRGVDPNAAS